MKVTYDKEADAIYIRFLDGDFQCRVVRVTDDVSVDFTEDERLVGIEVLGAHRLFSEPDNPAIDLRDIVPRIVAA